ncbi:hypothetical protein [Cysteiniphilum sp. 6C5]|uniref:hypothetical protein n=1 Tax=unclassified Cysteiniphilum TaxID=2610889 RepID=UPI003F860717
MANQYADSFVVKVKERFGKTAGELLAELSIKKMSYNEAAKYLGYKVTTIRKYCHRYNVVLNPSVDRIEVEAALCTMFYSKEINKFNILSRKWRHK